MNKNKRQVFPVITQAFLHQVRTYPNKAVFHVKSGAAWTSVSWKEYYDLVQYTALGLIELGLKPHENVCLLSNTRLEWSATDIAILGSLAVTVPIYASNTAEDVAYILNHCEARFLFVEDDKQLEKIASVHSKLPHLEKIIIFNPIKKLDEANLNILSLSQLQNLGKTTSSKHPKDLIEKNFLSLKPKDVLTICYTSGTTGVPKGAVLTHDNLTSVIEDIEKVIGDSLSSSDVLLSFLPISHVLGKIESMLMYQIGWHVYYAESIEKIFININEVKPTILVAVPRIFEKAYTRIKSSVNESSPVKQKLFKWAIKCGQTYYQKIWSEKKPTIAESLEFLAAKQLVFRKVYSKFGGRLRMCIAGGAPLPKEVGEFMQIIGITILEGYGLTETCAPVTLNPKDHIKYGSIGKPLPEVAMKIAGDGEILVKSRKVFREYYKNPQATTEVLDPEGWFHTGDIGVINGDGYVKITDRKKDLIVTSGGKKVAPQKIESIAKTNNYIGQFVVYGDKRNFLTALIVPDKEAIIKYATENHILFSEYGELVKNSQILSLMQSIIDEINGQLANYETIKRFKILPNEFTVDTGELTPSLKIRRRFCSEKYKQELDSLYGGPAPN